MFIQMLHVSLHVRIGTDHANPAKCQNAKPFLLETGTINSDLPLQSTGRVGMSVPLNVTLNATSSVKLDMADLNMSTKSSGRVAAVQHSKPMGPMGPMGPMNSMFIEYVGGGK